MSVSHDFPIPGTFLRLDDVLKVIPVCKAGWYNGIKEGRYPAPVAIGKRAVAWYADDIIALRDKLAAKRRELV